MYYIVKFLESNSIGIIRKTWMINKNKCKYPKSKSVSKLLEQEHDIDDNNDWKEFECVLKYPSKYGDPGIEHLKKARKKETFYVNYSDTDDYQKKKNLKKFQKEHPVSNLTHQTDLNFMIKSASKVRMFF